MQTLTKDELMNVNGGDDDWNDCPPPEWLENAITLTGLIFPSVGIAIAFFQLMPPIEGGSDQYSYKDVKFIDGNRPST